MTFKKGDTIKRKPGQYKDCNWIDNSTIISINSGVMKVKTIHNQISTVYYSGHLDNCFIKQKITNWKAKIKCQEQN